MFCQFLSCTKEKIERYSVIFSIIYTQKNVLFYLFFWLIFCLKILFIYKKKKKKNLYLLMNRNNYLKEFVHEWLHRFNP